jgi:hypothetical protein
MLRKNILRSCIPKIVIVFPRDFTQFSLSQSILSKVDTVSPSLAKCNMMYDAYCWSEGRNATLRPKSPSLSPCPDRQSGQGHTSLHRHQRQCGDPSLDSAPDEGLRRRLPAARPRSALRPTRDLAHCNGPCVAAFVLRA